MKFRHFIFFLFWIALAVVAQQAARYLMLSDKLHRLHTESTSLTSLIENAMQKEGEILQQLEKAQQQYHRLRELLPSELQEGAVEQQLNRLAGKYKIKVLATKTYINSRPLYREATINTTLEASSSQLKQLLRALQADPRIMTIAPPVSLGKSNTQLVISIYAQNPTTPAVIEPLRCADASTGGLLPLLNDRLAVRYADYSQRCRFIADHGEIYLKSQRLHALQGEIAQLQTLIAQLRAEQVKAQ